MARSHREEESEAFVTASTETQWSRHGFVELDGDKPLAQSGHLVVRPAPLTVRGGSGQGDARCLARFLLEFVGCEEVCHGRLRVQRGG